MVTSSRFVESIADFRLDLIESAGDLCHGIGYCRRYLPTVLGISTGTALLWDFVSRY